MNKEISVVTLQVQDLGQCTFESEIRIVNKLRPQVFNVTCYFKPNDFDIIDGEVITKSLQVYAIYINEIYANKYEGLSLCEIILSEFNIVTNLDHKILDLCKLITNIDLEHINDICSTPDDLVDYNIEPIVIMSLKLIKFDPNFDNLYKVKQKKLDNIIRVLREGTIPVQVSMNKSVDYKYKLTNINTDIRYDTKYFKTNEIIEPDFNCRVTAKIEMEKPDDILDSMIEWVTLRFLNMGVDNIIIKK